MSTYDAFYADERQAVLDSARAVAPIIIDWLHPRSVVDVGCGIGAWLAAFGELGIDELLGLDGPWVDPARRLVDESVFREVDLGQPFTIPRRFDLAVSLEVAEHLPTPAGDALISALAELAPVILFSAAIPGQRGPGHVNEQWPAHWGQKFAERGFVAVDCLRPLLWSDPRVAWYYAQNALLYVRSSELDRLPLANMQRMPSPPVLPLVHPRVFASHAAEIGGWIERVERLNRVLASHVPPGSALLVMDDESLGSLVAPGYSPSACNDAATLRSCPADQEASARSLAALLAVPAQYVALTWPVLWWLDAYPALARVLAADARLVHETEDVLIYVSRTPGTPPLPQ